MPLSKNVRHEIELILEGRNFAGQIVLNCNRSRVVELEVHRKFRPVPDDQEVVDLTEVARRSGEY